MMRGMGAPRKWAVSSVYVRVTPNSSLPCRKSPRSRTNSGTHVLVLVNDLEVTIINATTGGLLRELTIDTSRDYQPTGRPKGSQRNRKPPNH